MNGGGGDVRDEPLTAERVTPPAAERGTRPTAERDAADPLTAKRDAPLGGQAVLEGVMMRGVSTWAVAVRKPLGDEPAGADELGEIAVSSFPISSRAKRRRIYRLPVIRGVVALAESLGIGLRALSISANAQLPDSGEGALTARDRRSRAAHGSPPWPSRSCSPSACSSSSPSG